MQRSAQSYRFAARAAPAVRGRSTASACVRALNAPAEGPSARTRHPAGSAPLVFPACPHTDPPPSTTARRLFEDAIAIVEEEYASELSLDDIARRVASSRRQLQRAYAEIGNTTFREHLTRVRMERAAEMLADRGLTVREVARRVGYRQPAQFAKAFRRHLGVAPSDYRAGSLSNGSTRLAA